MKWSNIKTTIAKELRGIVRDKKALRTVLYLPIIIPAFILLFGFLFDSIEKTSYDIGVNYELTSEEKEIVKSIGDLNFTIYDNEKELKEAFDNKEISSYVIKENNTYTIYTDISTNSGSMVSMYLNNYFEAYNKVLSNKYLIENNIDPNLVYNNITINNENLGKEGVDPMVTVILSFIVTYVLMIVVLSAGVIATDATAGEKERGTLETILTFPIKSGELITGKYLAVSIFGIIFGLISLLLAVPTLYISKGIFESYKDISVNIEPLSMVLLVVIIIVSSLLISGVCMALAGNSKSYKEAQSSLQAISFLPMLPYFLQMLEVDTPIFSLIPIANCGIALNDIIMNNINVSSLLIIVVSTVIYTVLIILFVSKQYKNEKTLFM